MRVVMIGNAPSSGSTFLADLLDSLPSAVCGPELHLLSPLSHYVNFEKWRRRGHARATSPACYAAYADRLGTRALGDYGLDKAEVTRMLRQAEDFPAFVRAFARRYGAFRKKDLSLFFEKTPENIHAARHFLTAFPDDAFVHIVRHPLHVYRSLRRRGFGPYLAAATWLIDVAAAFALRANSRVLTIRYEDLVREPQATVQALFTELGERPLRTDIVQQYHANSYRAQIRRPTSWKYSDFGKTGDANCAQTEPADEAATAMMRSLTIAPAYARRFALPQITLIELAEYYGYSLGPTPGTANRWTFRRDIRSLQRLALKWIKEAFLGLAKPADLPIYLQPAISGK